MKYFFLFALALFVKNTFCQISKVEISHPVLTKAVHFYIDSLNLINQNGAIIIEFHEIQSPLNFIKGDRHYERFSIDSMIAMRTENILCVLYFQTRQESIRSIPPECYAVVRDIPVLFYSNLRFVVKPSEKEINILFKRLKQYFKYSQDEGFDALKFESYLKVSGSKFVFAKHKLW